MTGRLRLLLLGVAVLAPLATAATALAAFNPHLLVKGVQPVPQSATQIRLLAGGRDEDAAAVVKIGVPKGYSTSLAGDIGAKVGTVSGSALAIDLSRVVKISGTLTVARASEFTSGGCGDTATHGAVWAAQVTVSNQTMRFPIFIDSTPTAAVTSATLEACLPPADTPRGTAGRAPLGAKPVDLILNVTAIKSPAEPGIFRWRATATPYAPTVGTINGKSTVEVQSLAAQPAALTFTAKPGATKGAIRKVSIEGALTANGQGVPGVYVEILRGRKTIARIPTGNGGVYKAIGQVKKSTGSMVLTARAIVPDKDLGLGSCVPTFSPIPCIDTTLPGFTVKSKAISIRV